MSYFIKPNREQIRFQSLDIEKLIPEDHPARLFWKVCEQLDLQTLYDDYKITETSEGRPAHDPRVLLCLWLYAYREGIHSCRELAQMCQTRADFIWLCGDLTPQYRTLAYFRTHHTAALEDAFCKMVIALKKLGLIREKVFFQDGTKILANASSKSFMPKDKLEAKLARVKLAYQHFISYPEDNGTISEDYRRQTRRLEQQVRMIEKAVKQVNRIYERRQKLSKKNDRRAYQPEGAQASLTDPESQFMLVEGKVIKPAYNAQICVDGESEFIVGKGVSNEPTDVGELIPMVEGVKENLGISELRGAYVTDGGYYKDENIIQAEAKGVKELILPIKTDCKQEASQVVKRRAESIRGKDLLGKRRAIVERIISFIKERLKLRRFNLRGLIKVRCEWTLICLSYNLARYVQLLRNG